MAAGEKGPDPRQGQGEDVCCMHEQLERRSMPPGVANKSLWYSLIEETVPFKSKYVGFANQWAKDVEELDTFA